MKIPPGYPLRYTSAQLLYAQSIKLSCTVYEPVDYHNVLFMQNTIIYIHICMCPCNRTVCKINICTYIDTNLSSGSCMLIWNAKALQHTTPNTTNYKLNLKNNHFQYAHHSDNTSFPYRNLIIQLPRLQLIKRDEISAIRRGPNIHIISLRETFAKSLLRFRYFDTLEFFKHNIILSHPVGTSK